MEHHLSRRNFVSGVAAAGAGILGAAALSGCAGNTRTKKDTTGIKWDKEADVVIVGGGAAGLYAAIKAVENALTPIVLEKQPAASAGGDVRCSGGYLMGAASDPTVVLGTGSFGEANEDLAYAIDDEGTAATEWYIKEGYMEWLDQPFVVVKGGGPAVYEGQLAAANDADVEILFETPGHSLITNDDKEVIGVVAGPKDARINVKAKYGVLIATGSYTMDDELMANFHLPGFEYFSVGSPHVAGDGLIMAGELGAKLTKLAKGYEIMYLVSKPGSEEVGTGIFCMPPENHSVVIVNQDGERFIDEYTSFTHNKSTLSLFDFEGDMMQCRANDARYVNNRIIEIVDANTFNTCSLGNVNAGCSWANCMPEEEGGYLWSDDNVAELKKGWIIEGATLADLAEQLGLDPAKLQSTVDEYNALCATGGDPLGRADENLSPLGAGPYYALELATSVIYTIGGLTTDENGRTVNWRNEPIPRLYSAGNVGEVVTYLQPIAINGAWAQAAIAINDMAELEPWDTDLA